MLRDENSNIRFYTAQVLREIGDAAVAPLISILDVQEDEARFYAARSLAKIDDVRAEERLMDAYKASDLRIIAGAAEFFIKKGIAGSESTLILALGEYETKNTAELFLNCGNDQLEDAGTAWRIGTIMKSRSL